MAEDLLKGLPIFLDRNRGRRDVQAGLTHFIGLMIGSSACSSSVSARAPVGIQPSFARREEASTPVPLAACRQELLVAADASSEAPHPVRRLIAQR